MKYRYLLPLMAFTVGSTMLSAQETPEAEVLQQAAETQAELQIDPQIVQGKLPNGVKYVIRPTASVREIIDEANAQHNCVAGFIDKYAQGQTDLWLMRKAAKPDESLVTIESTPISCNTFSAACVSGRTRLSAKATSLGICGFKL